MGSSAGGQPVATAAGGGVPASGGKGGGMAGPSYEGLDAFQQSAQGMTQAYGGMQNAMNYQPMMVEGGGYSPNMGAGFQSVTAQQLDPNATDYAAAQFQQADLDRFMNPYTGEVIDQSMADIERSRLMQANQAAAQAQAAGAFGGSRGALMEAEIARNALDQSASTAANLRNQGFQFAAQQGQQDAARRQQALQQNAQQQLQSYLANQSSALQAGMTNAQLGAQTSMANQQAANQAQQFGLTQGLQAALANQGAGLQGAGMQMQGAQGLGALSNLGFGMGQQALQGMQQQGAIQQMLAQQMMDKAGPQGQFGGYQGAPANALSYLSQALGVTQTPQSSTTTSDPGAFGWMSMLLGSDARLKKNIRRVGKTPGGHNLYAWDWKKQAKFVFGKTGSDMGVLAQEVKETRPDLVIEFPDGYYRVNYGGIS
jgi:hypothetical protein